MQDFDKYVDDVCDYIEKRMRVIARYDKKYDSLRITFTSVDDFKMCIDNMLNQYWNVWRKVPVGSTAQQIMRDIKYEWVSLLMRKDNV